MNTISIALGILCLVTMFKPRFIGRKRNTKGQFMKDSYRIKAKKQLAQKQIEWTPIINSLNS